MVGQDNVKIRRLVTFGAFSTHVRRDRDISSMLKRFSNIVLEAGTGAASSTPNEDARVHRNGDNYPSLLLNEGKG